MSNGLYDAFRVNGAPTWYSPNKTAWQADILESGFIFAFVILATSFFVILPGIRGKERLFTFLRITLSLFVGAVIILANFSYTWETASVHTRTKYKAGTGLDITADIGVHIGLRGVNITLKGDPENQLNETINYNEHFSWEWEQGRLGFGPFAGRFSREYRFAQFRGLPLPILWVAEYFTLDGEGIRWGRHYRQAGWYTHIMLWLSFPLWLLTNIMFFVLLRYGAIFLFFTGLCMVIGNICWAAIRNFIPLEIPFSSEHILKFSYGGSFWICLITGILCVILGIVIYVLDLRSPIKLATFFGVDALQDADEVFHEGNTQGNRQDEDEDGTMPRQKNGGADIEMEQMAEDNEANGKPLKPPSAARKPMPIPEEDNDDELYEVPSAPVTGRYEKSVSRGLTLKRFQKSRRRPPPPPPPVEDDMYVNERFNVAPGDVHVNMD